MSRAGTSRAGASRSAVTLLVAPLAVLALLLAPAPALAAGTPPQNTWSTRQADLSTAARAAGRDGQGITVAVLDSWVDAGHPDFEGRVLAGADCLGGSCRAGPASRDRCDHGTHVAGTVASSSYGVATAARVLPVRVLAYDPGSGDCVGRPDDVANGIRWAVEHGAQVLNLSLGPDLPGLSGSSALPDAVRAAADAGVVVVFSAGNSNLPVADSYGGNALVVAATGPSGRLASYSQHGAGVDLAAPGGDPAQPGSCTQDDCVTSLYPDDRYAVAAGTSMAAPHVAGVAALLLAQDPSRTRQQLAQRLEATARPLPGAGAGMLDAAAALGVPRAQSLTAPRPAPARPLAAPAAASRPGAPTRPLPVRPVMPPPTGLPVTARTQAPSPLRLPRTSPVPGALPVRRPGPAAADVPLGLATVAALLLVLPACGVIATARRRRR